MKKKNIIIMIFMLVLVSLPIKIHANNLTKGYHLVVNSKINKMGYFKDGILVKEFDVATGKISSKTPEGKFKIVNKIKNRPYYSGGIAGGDPKNPLGDRWLGLHVGASYGDTYAIHGNNNENSIGSNVSAGCIRMHNNDIRWLFDQIPVGTEVIIYSTNDNYVDIAKKYNITLSMEKPLTYKQQNVKNKFQQFAIYGNLSSPIIDLRNTNEAIYTTEIANNILNLGTSTSKSDRQLFLDAWNSLSEEEKRHSEMQSIYNKYIKIIKIVECAQAINSFYDNVGVNAYTLISDYNKAVSVNSLNNNNMGYRGLAEKRYLEAIKYEQSTPRMKDLEYKYNEAVRFLEVSEAFKNRNASLAKAKIDKLTNNTLKTVASEAYKNYSDISNHWAENTIKEAMNENLVVKTNIFRPEDYVSRAEFITMINRYFGFNEVAEVSFKDVKPSDWYYNEVSTALANGYISGYEGNLFKPNGKITREEVATIISRIKSIQDTNLDKLNFYNDGYKVSDWAKPSFEGIIESGYISGYEDNTLRPKNNLTRAEAVVVIKRIEKN